MWYTLFIIVHVVAILKICAVMKHGSVEDSTQTKGSNCAEICLKRSH